MAEHRAFLQSHVKWLAWVIGIIIGLAVAIFIYNFGDSIENIKSRITAKFDKHYQDAILMYACKFTGEILQKNNIKELYSKQVQKLINYRLDESIRKKQNEFDRVIKQDIQRKMQNAANDSMDNIIEKTSKALNANLNKRIHDQVKNVANLTSSDLIEKLAFPKGDVVAFNLKTCPKGWKEFKPGKGRFIVGIGTKDGLTSKSLLNIGGSETHRLSTGEIPSHKHETVEAGDARNSEWGVSGPRNGRHGVSWQTFATSFTGPTGGGKPHNNMPPYVACLWCEKK